ncbi:MAG: hypothetical protein ACT4OI_07365 [Methanobacteriota archaeon]
MFRGHLLYEGIIVLAEMPPRLLDPFGNVLQLAVQGVIGREGVDAGHGWQGALGQRAQLGFESTAYALRDVLVGRVERAEAIFDILEGGSSLLQVRPGSLNLPCADSLGESFPVSNENEDDEPNCDQTKDHPKQVHLHPSRTGGWSLRAWPSSLGEMKYISAPPIRFGLRVDNTGRLRD